MSEKYKGYIINLLIKYGYCYEVMKIFGIEEIKKHYESIFTPKYYQLIGIYRGDSFLVNMELLRMYQENELSFRSMEKELFLKDDKLVNIGKSSIQRLSIKAKEFNHKDYSKNKIKKCIYPFPVPLDRLEEEIIRAEKTQNETLYFKDFFNGNLKQTNKCFYKYRFDKDLFNKNLKKYNGLKTWKIFIKDNYETDQEEIIIKNNLNKIIISSLVLEYVTQTEKDFIRYGGVWLYDLALGKYIEYFIKNNKLEDIGIINFDKKNIK
ncbi:MAG: hypothetical protein ACRC4T_16515 [Cetobacterium sp.]